MSMNIRNFTRRRFAAALGLAFGFALARPSRALAALVPPRRATIDPQFPTIVNRPMTIHGNASMGDVVMRRGALVLRGGGTVDIRRLDSRF